MDKSKKVNETWVVIRDGWIPDGYFATLDEAHNECERLNNSRYLGHWTYSRCSADHPRRFMKAITNG